MPNPNLFTYTNKFNFFKSLTKALTRLDFTHAGVMYLSEELRNGHAFLYHTDMTVLCYTTRASALREREF